MAIRKWLSRRRAFSRLVDREAAALIAQEGASAYYTARRRGLVAQEQHEIETADFWNAVRLRIADRADLAPYRRRGGLPTCDWLFSRKTRMLQS